MSRYGGRRGLLLALALAVAALTAGCAGRGQCGYHECPEEATLRLDIERRIAGYPELRGPNVVYVQVHGHLVLLSGQVNTDYERQLAERVAAEAAGVSRVVNMIGLSYSGR